jgi:hypothetical protein
MGQPLRWRNGSVAITAIPREIPITNTHLSQLQACFLIACGETDRDSPAVVEALRQ